MQEISYQNYKLKLFHIRKHLQLVVAAKYHSRNQKFQSFKHCSVYFAEQHLVNLEIRVLKVERINRNPKIIGTSILKFYPVGSLSLLVNEQFQNVFTTFCNRLRRSNLSKCIIFWLMLALFAGCPVSFLFSFLQMLVSLNNPNKQLTFNLVPMIIFCLLKCRVIAL